MAKKLSVKSYKAVSSKQVRRRCSSCKRVADAERVDYGKGGILLFCECGHAWEPRKKNRD